MNSESRRLLEELVQHVFEEVMDGNDMTPEVFFSGGAAFVSEEEREALEVVFELLDEAEGGGKKIT